MPDRSRATVLMLLALGLILGGPERIARAADPPLRMVASIFPLADVGQQVGGEVAQVETLLPAGETPHGYWPKPPQVEMLARADLLLLVGIGVDSWASQSAEVAGNQHLHVLVFSEVVEIGSFSEAGSLQQLGEGTGVGHPHRAHEHADAGDPDDAQRHRACIDPHLWLDPVLMEKFVAALAETLCVLRPGMSAGIRERAADYRADLRALDLAWRERLSDIPGRIFVTLHSAFGYLAARYGLEEVALYTSHMQEPDPRALESVVRIVREEDIRVIFIQPQISPHTAQWFGEQTGAELEILDPLGHPARPGYEGYLQLMESNLRALERGLRLRE